MRHTRLGLTLSIRSLATAMCLLARRCRLIAAAGCRQLSLPHSLPAGATAIALSAVTTATDGKHRVAARFTTPAQAKTLGAWLCCVGSGHSHHDTRSADDGTMIAPSADDVARLAFRKLRFLMTDNR
jgi:hypothetical protein